MSRRLCQPRQKEARGHPEQRPVICGWCGLDIDAWQPSWCVVDEAGRNLFGAEFCSERCADSLIIDKDGVEVDPEHMPCKWCNDTERVSDDIPCPECCGGELPEC